MLDGEREKTLASIFTSLFYPRQRGAYSRQRGAYPRQRGAYSLAALTPALAMLTPSRSNLLPPPNDFHTRWNEEVTPGNK
ncbi:MAG: hypothetical protein EBE86_029475 [Hormoscilla sp. GUM202]|nr:hypothetical protein [Hormoscilla sp. GUM202]